MKLLRIISLYLLTALILFQCDEKEAVNPENEIMNTSLLSATQDEITALYQTGSTYYVTTTGNDGTGDGSTSNPWKTLRYAVTRVPASQGHTIKLSAGTFVESGLIEVPVGVNIEGAGKDQTILKAASTFYYNPASPSYATDRFLISLTGFNYATGNQILKNFTIDGDAKKLHGGIYVHYKSNVAIDQVKVQNSNFTGIWLWDVKDVQLTNTDLVNCSWGSSGWCAGALNLGNLERVEISNLNVNESTGYGIKAIGPSGYNNIFQLKIHDSHVSVHPYGLWNGGSAPNIAIELWGVTLVGSEISNTYVDNTISLVNSNMPPSTGIQAIRVHGNILDMQARAQGAGYGVELSIHDAEVDHNYFLGGTYGIANWDNPVQNWNIHHNVFYAMQGTYPGEAVRSQWSGLHNVKFYNNTVEFNGTKTMNVIGVYGGTSENVDLKNNLVINSNTGYSYYQNQLLHRENGAALSNLSVNNNLFNNLDLNVGGLVGGALGILDPLLKNSTVNPQIVNSGVRPDPYYLLSTGSPMIDAGTNVGMTFQGSAPDIGAYESGTPANVAPSVSITSPPNNANFALGTPITIAADANDDDGTVNKVEFFSGSTKLGEDVTSPYSFAWANATAGSHSLTTIATDNAGTTTISTPIAVTVAGNSLPATSITSPANNSSFTSGSPITIAATAADEDGAISKVEFFSGTTKLGEDVTAPYSFSWTNSAAGSYSLTTKATDNAGGTTTSTPIAVTITGNSLPAVSITSPVTNSSFTSGTAIAINATATDSDGAVSKVEFYQGSTKLGEDTTSPYSFTWTNPAAGSYSLTASAIDNGGATKTSSVVAVTVTAGNVAPSVSLTSPANNSSFAPGSLITINAIATDSDGSVAKVEFYSDANKIGEDVTAPYSFVLAAPASGGYALTARAFDNLGAFTTSPAVGFTVSTQSFVQVKLDASQASLSGAMTLGTAAQAGNYFYVPTGNGTNYYIPPSSAASYSFQVSKADSYVMWVRVKAPSATNQSYYIYDGQGHWTTWSAGVHIQWTWVKVKDAYTGSVVNFSFVQGTNNIQFGWLDENVQVDKLVISNNPNFIPN